MFEENFNSIRKIKGKKNEKPIEDNSNNEADENDGNTATPVSRVFQPTN